MGMVFENRSAWVPRLDDRRSFGPKPWTTNRLRSSDPDGFRLRKFETYPDWGARSSSVDNTRLYSRLDRQSLCFQVRILAGLSPPGDEVAPADCRGFPLTRHHFQVAHCSEPMAKVRSSSCRKPTVHCPPGQELTAFRAGKAYGMHEEARVGLTSPQSGTDASASAGKTPSPQSPVTP
jgi:hypothetical protein